MTKQKSRPQYFPPWLWLHIIAAALVGGLGTTLLAAGLLGFFSPKVIFTLSAIWLTAGLVAAVRWVRWRPAKFTSGEKTLFAGCVVVALLTALQALLPPTGRDALIHHLALPLWYLHHGQILDLPFAEQAYNPMLLDLLYALPLALAPESRRFDVLAQLLHFGFALLTAHLLFHYVTQACSRVAGLIAACLFLSLPIVVQLGTQAYVDLGLAYFACLMWVLIDRWLQDPARHHFLIFAGLAGGLAMGCKYNGYLVVALTGFFLIAAAARCNIGRRRIFHAVLMFCAAVVVVHWPWWLKNQLWTGDPVYPFFRSFWGFRGTPAESLGSIPALLHRYYLYHESIADILALPVRLFFSGEENNPQQFDGKISPVLLLFLPFCFFYKRRDGHRHRIHALVFLTVVYFIYAVFFSILRMRYLLPIIPLLVVLTVIGFERARKLSPRWRRSVVWGVMVLALVHNGYVCVSRFRQMQTWDYLAGHISRDAYLEARLPEYKVQQYANRHLTQDAKILFVLLGDRGYYCNIPYTYDFHDPGRSWRRWSSRAQDGQGMKALVRSEGITHLMMHGGLFSESFESGLVLNEPQKIRVKEFVQKDLHPVFNDGAVILLQVEEEP